MIEKINWEMCKEQNFAKRVQPDLNQINSILESAANREKTANLLPFNDTTKETVISLAYDVLRELLEALALKKGYKIYNHECFSCFLHSIMKEESLSLEFDSLRMLRNSINYYGKKLPLEDAKISLVKLNNLISDIKKLLN